MAGQVHPSHVLSESTFRRFKALKESNNHGECYQEAAKALDLDELVQKFARINRIHKEKGELSFDLNNERYGLYQELLKGARARLSQSQYDRFYMCF
jgi:hypothetical protein